MNERGRVPFALVGVLLVVSSATLTTVGTVDPGGRPPVDRAMEGATAEVVTELRGAAEDAATRTVAAPPVRPANTTVGRAIDGDDPVRDALRLRLYLLAADRLDRLEVRRGGIVVTASVPAVEPTTPGYRAALERVTVERHGPDGAALRVAVDDVRLTATRDGRTVATDEVDASFVVANPALLLHDRTERFERRANAGVAEPGLGRRLTTRLYPIAWTRGYAQYGGAPISTVVGTRHVEYATNDALLAEQRAAFGSVDPDGDRGVAAAGRRVATADLLEPVDDGTWTDAVLDREGSGTEPGAPTEPPDGSATDAGAAPEVPVGVNGSADRAYAAVVGIGAADSTGEAASLDEVLDRAHTVEARLETDVGLYASQRRGDDEPGEEWELVDESTDRTVAVREADVPPLSHPGWSTRTAATFDVMVDDRTTRTWRRRGAVRTTEAVTEREYRVQVAVQVRAVPLDGVDGGDLDAGLSDAADRAAEAVLEEAGGLRAAARSAVGGDGGHVRATTTADPVVDRATVAADLRSLRERTRNISVRSPAARVAAGEENPPERLREELADRRDDLAGPQGRSVEARAIRAARVAYLDALDAELGRRAARHDETADGVGDVLADHVDFDRLDEATAAHREASRPPPDRFEDPAGNVTLSVEAGPSYLPTSRPDRGTDGGDRSYPLATRNVNAFASPHGQIAGRLVDLLPLVGDRGTVRLTTAAQTLRASEDMAGTERARLLAEVASAADHVHAALVDALVDAGVPRDEAEAAVYPDAGSTAGRALALANGSVVETGAETLGDDDAERDRLRIRLELTRREALEEEAARPSRSATAEVAEATRDRLGDELEDALADGLETAGERARVRVLGDRLGSLPAGLPLAPVPGYWYATANLWYVDVAGRYDRFAVHADRGGPTGATTYRRAGQNATLRQDGERLRLGTAERISFRTRTVVVVVVPPGPRGVGDTDGVVDERSPGWPP